MTNAILLPYVRKPFAVKAVRITEENIEELAEQLGEVKVKGREKYISLDRRIVPNVGRAFVGWWVTRLGDNLRCYSNKVFRDQFVLIPEDRLDQPISFLIEDIELDDDGSMRAVGLETADASQD